MPTQIIFDILVMTKESHVMTEDEMESFPLIVSSLPEVKILIN